jgi:NarL family two-component system response regulator LiaR
MPITVLLADDHNVLRLAIKRALESEPGIQLLGEATDWSQTLKLIAQLKPDVAVIDLHMPGRAELTADFIKSQLLLFSKHVVMISIWDDENAQAVARLYGAETLLDKADLSNLIQTILRWA